MTPIMKGSIVMKVVVYSTPTCPTCKMIKTKLDRKNIPYESCEDVVFMQQNGITTVPTLEVDGVRYTTGEANKWINQQ